MHQPHSSHWTVVKGILRYLKGIITHGLLFQSGPLHLEAYSDANYAGCPIDRRSTSGYCVYLGFCPISCSAKKQATMSRSNTKAEYWQLALTIAELSWLCLLLKELNIFLPQPPLIWCDYISFISLCSNPIYHARLKHLEVDYHFVREKVVHKELCVRYLNTVEQIADVFTKGLTSARFRLLRDKLMVHDCPMSL